MPLTTHGSPFAVSYRLKQYDRSGFFRYTREIAVMTGAVPGTFTLEQNYPNPFNPVTTISYGLPVRSKVRIEVFNILGEVVLVLLDREEAAGYGEVQWAGSGMSTGHYFYRIEAVAVDDPGRRFVGVKKTLLIK